MAMNAWEIANFVGIIVLIGMILRLRSSIADRVVNATNQANERTERSLRDDLSKGRSESLDQAHQLRQEVVGSINNFGTLLKAELSTLASAQRDHLNDFGKHVKDLNTMTGTGMEKLRSTVDQRLDHLQKDNNQKLDEMRNTVNEKLQGTLNTRLQEAFKHVSERLEKVHQGLGEMQTLTSGVGDLKRMLTNVKTRGTWGEYQLGNILEEFLSPEQYEANVAVKPRSDEKVEYAIKMPGYSGELDSFIYLPIDSKFPLEAYQRLTAALDNGDSEAAKTESSNLEKTILKEAKRISEKYIVQGRTTPFAIMFVPTEGLYAEILRRPGLSDKMQKDYQVMLTGPTNLVAFLTSLRIGFRTLAIQQHSSDIAAHLFEVKNHFKGFSSLLENVRKKLDSASEEIGKATNRSKTIERDLEKFDNPAANTSKLVQKVENEEIATLPLAK